MHNAVEGLGDAIHAQAHRTREALHAAGKALKHPVKHKSSGDLSEIPARAVDVAFRFIGASGLPAMDVGAHSDPFFVATLDKKISYTSSVQTGTVTPVWNEHWFVKNVPQSATLKVKVFDKDDGTVNDDFIGKFKLGLQEGPREVRIESSFGTEMGIMWLEVHIITFPGILVLRRYRR